MKRWTYRLNGSLHMVIVAVLAACMRGDRCQR
jgi:hypothetical protein